MSTDHVSFAGGDASGEPGYGGAIYDDGGTVQVNSGTFSNNSASASGGAIYNADGTLNVVGATFTANAAVGFGGAIENDGVSGIRSSTFRGNTAYSGGAAYNESGTLTIANSSFTDNQTPDAGTVAPKGDVEPRLGAGVASLAQMTLTGDRFDSNGTGTSFKGGGVYNDGTATLTGSTLSGNQAVAGGGLYNDATATLTSDTIQANSTAHDGGGIYNFGQLTVSKTKIHGNSAGLDGGGLLNGAFANVSGSQIYRNSAGIGGGGIHDYYKLMLVNTAIDSNTPDNCESRLGATGCDP